MIPISLLVALVTFVQVGIGRTLLATVLDQRNQPVVDIDVDDFVIRESGQAREILSARVADYPVVVLVDTGARAPGEFEAIRAAAAGFIARVGQRPVAVGTLGAKPTMVASFEDDRPVVLARLNALMSEPADRSQIVQGMANAAQAVRALDAPFSAIVVVAADPAAMVDDAPTGWLRQILDSHAIVDIVVHRPGDATTSASELHALTEQTHGQLTTIYSVASYQIALEHLADQMAGEMLVEYIEPGAAAPKEDVTVGVRVPGLRVKGLGVR